MITLNVNIDHVATIRQARGVSEPDPAAAAILAELAGATGIVCHLREDRRHINDRDLILLREVTQTKLDLEMAAVDEIIDIAIATKPDLVTIVPEKREELTTEGGLDVKNNFNRMKALCSKMHDNGIEVSFFIEPSGEQIEYSINAGADMVELHTGTYANLADEFQKSAELYRILLAATSAAELSLKVAAGHGLNYFNTQAVCVSGSIDELSIGHAIISRSVFVGIDRAVRDMIELIRDAELLIER